MLQRQALDVLFGFIIRRSEPTKFPIRIMAQTGAKILSKIKRFNIPFDLSSVYCHMLLGTYESERVSVCKRFLRPGMTAVDVGAHVGYYTRLFSKLVGSSGKVYAFEPHHKNFEILKNNVERFENVLPIQNAVADREREVILYEASTGSGSHSLTEPEDHYGEKLPVKAVSLDGFLQDTTVDLIKIDVEGYEIEVLNGAKEIIKKSAPINIIVEVHSSELKSRGLAPQGVLDILTELGCKLYGIEENVDTLIPITSWEQSYELFTKLSKNSLFARKEACPVGP